MIGSRLLFAYLAYLAGYRSPVGNGIRLEILSLVGLTTY